eukprot:SAG31_NODE_2821_length_5040_cov_14.991500_7_plen_44_part_00
MQVDQFAGSGIDTLFCSVGLGKGCCFLVFMPTIREIRDFYREM